MPVHLDVQLIQHYFLFKFGVYLWKVNSVSNITFYPSQAKDVVANVAIVSLLNTATASVHEGIDK